MKTEIKLNGSYKVFNGKDCDNYPYWTILVVTEDEAWIGEFTTHSHLIQQDLKLVKLEDGEDLFTKLGIIHHQKM